MALETDIHLGYDPNTPRTQHAGLAAAMYGDVLKQADSILNVAAGGTDLGADLHKKGIDADVTSLDPTYAYPDYFSPGRTDMRHGYAQDMPFEDETFAATICQFGVQHMAVPTWGRAIQEMVRVTQKAEHANDPTKGFILINPVFKPKQLLHALETAGVTDVAGIMGHDKSVFPLAARKAIKPTLWLQKTDALTDERLQAVIQAATSTRALKPTHRSLGELTSRALGGTSAL